MNVRRQGDQYTAQVGPPSISQMWMTDRPYQREELRSAIEALGVHPIDVAEAFDYADARAARGNRPSAEEIRLGEQMWPRNVPDEQHVAAIMDDSGSSAVEAKLLLDLVRGDIDMQKFKKRLFWQRVLRFFS